MKIGTKRGPYRQNKARVSRVNKRRSLIAELFDAGFSVKDIEESMGRDHGLKVASTTVYADIRLMTRKWQESALSSMDKALRVQLDRIERALMIADREFEMTLTKEVVTHNEDGQVVITTKRRVGDPVWFAERTKLIKLWGETMGLTQSVRVKVDARQQTVNVGGEKPVTLRDVLLRGEEPYGDVLQEKIEAAKVVKVKQLKAK